MTTTRTDPLDDAECREVTLSGDGRSWFKWFRVTDRAGRIWGYGNTPDAAWAFARREVRREREKQTQRATWRS